MVIEKLIAKCLNAKVVMSRSRMAKFLSLCQFCLIFVSLQRSAGNKLPIIEDTGDDDWNVVLTYLDYAEPTFDHRKALTTDDFTDNYEGYQTEGSIAKTFGWDFSGYGEVPYAAMLVSTTNPNLACMGMLVTRNDLLTPCACVRSKIFKDANKQDKEPNKWFYYRNDLGNDIFVVADEIEFDPNKGAKDKYPRVDKVVSSKKCLEIYEEAEIEDEIDVHRQKWTPAILNITRKIRGETYAVGVWPPEQISYSAGPYDVGTGDEAWKFYGKADDSPGYYSQILSYRFVPEDVEKYKSRDNFNRRQIKVQDRLVGLSVRLCVQSACYHNDGFFLSNKYLQSTDQLVDMLCFCDHMDMESEDAFMTWDDAAHPHYTKTVYEGLLGAPVIHKGDWVAWIVHPVNRTASTEDPRTQWPIRTTWARCVDDEIIGYVNEVIPELRGGNRPLASDKTRPGFALKDNQIFIPDYDLQEQDVDFQSYNREGFRRHYRLVKKSYSASPIIMPGHATLTSIILLFNL